MLRPGNAAAPGRFRALATAWHAARRPGPAGPSPRPARASQLALFLAVLAGEPLVQAGGQGALGGQVIFQRQDPHRGSQRVALVEQFPDPGGEGQLTAGIAAATATGPLRGTASAASRARRNACWTPRTSAARRIQLTPAKR
jgi:hypothetical protein